MGRLGSSVLTLARILTRWLDHQAEARPIGLQFAEMRFCQPRWLVKPQPIRSHLKFMRGFFRGLSLVFLLVALGGFAALWGHDLGQGFHYDAAHQRKGSPPFIFIGVAFIAFQLSQPDLRWQQIKGLLLGSAFALWGAEQFIQPSWWLTILDDLVIGVFVVDLGLVIGGQFWEKK